MKGRVYIGTSGFYYAHWKGVFYPQDLPKTKYFDYYVKNFDTVELNSTFYHLPKEKTVEHWNEKTPEDFIFSLKAYRGITHYKRLKDVKDDIYLYLHLLKPLKRKIGIILFQLPPSLKKDLDLLASFLHILPTGYHYAVEFRNDSWYFEDTYELLRHYNVSFCIHDFERKKSPIVETSDNIYIRFHGPSGRYTGSYSDKYLKEWALKIKDFTKRNKKVFCYFNNDFEGYAVLNAKKLLSFIID
ncbi:DUF72 domain-containing protein [Nitrosophilus kaiyonis]|uniref:DUF72 domain-containing protein n=1 Tax=Nitrosophilus kaiyonis TaxID=2930200 RepID=UPI0024933ECA|nr:DUF72 domain-containing protein [Nitrosophilus kaiyonis]